MNQPDLNLDQDLINGTTIPIFYLILIVQKNQHKIRTRHRSYNLVLP